jgi:hypothetical protein
MLQEYCFAISTAFSTAILEAGEKSTGSNILLKSFFISRFCYTILLTGNKSQINLSLK